MSATAELVPQSAGQPAPKLGPKRERTRRKILEAAFGLIGNEESLTVRIEEVCAAARISRGTFYNYFASLEQLFQVLAIEFSHDLNQALVLKFDEIRSHAEGSNAAIQHYLERARRDLVEIFVLEKIASTRRIYVTENEVLAEIANMAAQYNRTPAEMMAYVERNNLAAPLRSSLRERKTLRELRDVVKLVDAPAASEGATDA